MTLDWPAGEPRVPNDLCSLCGMRNDETQHGRCLVLTDPEFADERS